MANTTHGFHIKGSMWERVTDLLNLVDCGGPATCLQCSDEITAYYAKYKIAQPEYLPRGEKELYDLATYESPEEFEVEDPKTIVWAKCPWQRCRAVSTKSSWEGRTLKARCERKKHANGEHAVVRGESVFWWTEAARITQ